MNRERARAVPHDHPNCHDALRDEEHVRPDDVVYADQGAHTSPPQVGGHADEVDDAARADPPRRGRTLRVLGLEHVPRPLQWFGRGGVGAAQQDA